MSYVRSTDITSPPDSRRGHTRRPGFPGLTPVHVQRDTTMATRRTKPASAARTKSDARSTVAGAARGAKGADAAARKAAGTQDLAAAFPANAAKPGEFGEAARHPPRGQSKAAADASVTSSTLTERNSSSKVGTGKPALGADPNHHRSIACEAMQARRC